MRDKHYKNELSAYVNGEMSDTERETVAGHLAACDECSREHDAIKCGASLAANLRQADAPDSLWREIEERLVGAPVRQIGLIPQASFFSVRKGFAFAAALIAVSVLSAIVFLNLFDGDSPYRAQRNASQINSVSPANVDAAPANEANSQPNTNVNNTNTNQTGQPPSESWQVETIAGMPRVGDGTDASAIAVGQQLETDARSKAKITVADIGTVEIGQNSLVRFVGTGKDEHRLALERGRMHAKIFAPPRLFVVDTPSGKAVDLGCEYTLEVDKRGDSLLHVTGGFVALERPGRESIVPAGMMCRMKGGGVGTPFSTESTANFRRALDRFDFSSGGSASVQALVKEADFYDMVTLWHLLSRVSKDDRGVVFDALAKYVAPPAGVTRDGVIALDKKMIDLWRTEVETVWFS